MEGAGLQKSVAEKAEAFFRDWEESTAEFVDDVTSGEGKDVQSAHKDYQNKASIQLVTFKSEICRLCKVDLPDNMLPGEGGMLPGEESNPTKIEFLPVLGYHVYTWKHEIDLSLSDFLDDPKNEKAIKVLKNLPGILTDMVDDVIGELRV